MILLVRDMDRLKEQRKEARPSTRSDHTGGDDPVGRGEGKIFRISLPVNNN